ncbi:MAG: Ldh family oxidoreductase [Nitrospinae bacterium]|nr:Ldh family oxidoreductase [Nitrospinota bacterium]
MPHVSPAELRSLGEKIFAELQVPREEAQWVAELLVRANLAGHDSHGVIRIPQYAQAIQSGQVQPGAPLEVVKESPATALLNGNGGLGQVVARRAMELAIQKAKATKVSAVGVSNLYHVGRLADYTRMAAEQDLLGIMTVNGGGASPIVAPFGGMAGRLATNPISIAFPTGGAVPFLLDMATSVVAEGKVRVKRNRGEQVPEGWLLDNQGLPTTDPQAFYQEPRGAILPLGGGAGHKGFGLALVVEILSGILMRADYAREDADRFSHGTFIAVIDIRAFVDPAEFRTETDALLHYLERTPKAPGVEAILYPGEPELAEQRTRERDGIPLEDETWHQLLTLAQALGITIAAP